MIPSNCSRTIHVKKFHGVIRHVSAAAMYRVGAVVLLAVSVEITMTLLSETCKQVVLPDRQIP
jgi:hypothetical protein